MTRPKRTIEDLQKASDHLHYEIGMLLSLKNDMATGVAGDNQTIKNALIEVLQATPIQMLEHVVTDAKFIDVTPKPATKKKPKKRKANVRQPKNNN